MTKKKPVKAEFHVDPRFFEVPRWNNYSPPPMAEPTAFEASKAWLWGCMFIGIVFLLPIALAMWIGSYLPEIVSVPLVIVLLPIYVIYSSDFFMKRL